MERLLVYTQEQGYAPYTSTLKEAWRMSVVGISRSLLDGWEAAKGEPQELFADERFTDEEPNTSAEAQLLTGFDAFDVGDVDIYTKITTYSNPLDGGRFRMDIDARIAWEIFSDFTVGLNVTERFDSNPPSATAAKRDYQYALSIGWSWS